MRCCPETIVPFTNQSVTDIPYALEYGNKPVVTALYLVAGEWIAEGVLTSIKLIGSPTSLIRVDHGGPSTGIIKLS